MIRETLLDKAKKDIAVAEALYRQPEVDELFLDAISYHIQQAVEKALKYQMEESGIHYDYEHDIQNLIDAALDGDENIIVTDYIKDNTDMLTNWESKTRYITGYRVVKNRVDAAIKEARRFVDLVSQSANEK